MSYMPTTWPPTTARNSPAAAQCHVCDYVHCTYMPFCAALWFWSIPSPRQAAMRQASKPQACCMPRTCRLPCKTLDQARQACRLTLNRLTLPAGWPLDGCSDRQRPGRAGGLIQGRRATVGAMYVQGPRPAAASSSAAQTSMRLM